MEPAAAPVIVVSGLPRSGTSMVMQMLQAGGIPVLTDKVREADDDNPRGYLEFERVKQLKGDKTWLDEASGKAVKIVHLLLQELPPDREYRLVMLHRDLREVVRSQATMLERSGRRGAALPPEKLSAIYASQMAAVESWLAARPNFRVHHIDYAAVIANPAATATSLNAFLGGGLDVGAMARAVDPALHRNRS